MLRLGKKERTVYCICDNDICYFVRIVTEKQVKFRTVLSNLLAVVHLF